MNDSLGEETDIQATDSVKVGVLSLRRVWETFALRQNRFVMFRRFKLWHNNKFYLHSQVFIQYPFYTLRELFKAVHTTRDLFF